MLHLRPISVNSNLLIGDLIKLDKLLQWCLTQSLQPDGSFKFWIRDNSKEETTFYGAAFLARIGYFDKSKRFWTDKEFPEAATSA